MSATLQNHVVTSCALRMPAWGVWWADVEIDQPAELTGAVALEVSGLTLAGAVVSGGPWSGRGRYRVAAGAGRWGVEIPAKSYANDLGVKISTVLGDAAAAVGETLDTIAPTLTVGRQWSREAGPASRQLHAIRPRAWHVGADGVTRLGAWPASTHTGEVTVMSRDDARGVYELAAESVAGIVPGATVAGLVAVDVEHRVTPKGTRTTVWTGDGIATGLDALARHFSNLHRYRGVASYRVVSQSSERLNLQIERASTGLGDLHAVPVRLAPGIKATWAPGSLCLVAFVDGSPSRPVVVAGDDPDSPAHVPSVLTLDASTQIDAGDATGRVLREGDTLSLSGVQAGGTAPTVVATIVAPTTPSRVYA